jgi:hypothetical protein
MTSSICSGGKCCRQANTTCTVNAECCSGTCKPNKTCS